MIGAIIGDIVGSIYEFNNIETKEFELFNTKATFTDDTICSVALADCLLHNGNPVEYLQKYCRKYNDPMGGYGSRFSSWIWDSNALPYGSWGNGAAMRISSVPFYLNNWADILSKAKEYTEITHDHEFGIIGAVSTCEAIHLGKTASNKRYLYDILKKYYPEYNLDLKIDDIREFYSFNESCQDTVPYAIYCVIESTDFEDAVRNAISIGGDSDTLACIAGGIAQAYYKEVPQDIIKYAYSKLPNEFVDIIKQIK